MSDRRYFALYTALHGVYWSAHCSVFSFATVYLLDQGFNNAQIGIILALSNIAAVLLQQPIAAYMDRTTRFSLNQLVCVLSVLLLPLFALLLFVHLPLLCIGIVYVVILSVVLMLQSFINAIGMEFVNHNINVNFGISRGSGSLVNGCVMIVLGGIVASFGVDTLIVAAILFTLLVILVVLSFRLPKVEKKGPATQKLSMLSFFKRYPRFMVMVVGVTLCFYIFFFTINYLIHFIEPLGGGETELGISMGMASLLEVPTMFAFGMLAKRFRISDLMKAACLFMVVNGLAVTLAPSVGFIYATNLIYMIGFALFPPASVFYTNHCMREEDRVQGQAIVVASNLIGCVLSSLIGGWMIDTYGIMIAAWWGIGISTLGMLIVFWAIKRTPSPRQMAADIMQP